MNIGNVQVVLASASPRRKELLEEAGINVQVHVPDVDDGQLRRGPVPPQQWVMALAYLKARRVREMLDGQGSQRLILGADTVCVHEGKVLGQPRNAELARQMLRGMRHTRHVTMTGVCLLRDAERLLLFDSSEVHIGDLSDAEIDAYIASGQWRGKAGGYNLSERIAAGWPIRCIGDPATVMGLPMRKLGPLLAGVAAVD